jgi:ferric enterobactin receptor
MQQMNILPKLTRWPLIFATMMKPGSILFFFFLFIPFFFGQQPGNYQGRAKGLTGVISGTLIDSITSEPVTFASVGILETTSGKVVNGGLSDDRGVFRINDVPEGQYTIQVSFIGYATKSIEGIELTPQHPDFNAGNISLSPESKLLEEVKVLGEAALIEAKPDKIVYNAEHDVTTRGGDASDVLRKVPLLAVDLDGNVSMRGSENVRILINGRPSGMFNSNIADALKMMPADQIKSVEVITAPSAKYDAEGTAGIINIITKKKNIEGLTGNTDVTTGTRSTRGNVNINYGKGRLGLNASGGGHFGYPQDGTSTLLREENLQSFTSILNQSGTTNTSRYGYRTGAGFEYNANAFNVINGSVSYRGGHNTNDNEILSQYNENEILVDSYLRKQESEFNRGGWDLELDFKHLFPKKDKEWSFSVELDRDNDHSDAEYGVYYVFPIDQVPTLDNNLNKGDNREWSIQTDYTHPFSDRWKVETGLKASLRNIESGFTYLQFDQDVMDWFINPERTDVFHYDQNVYAAYASSTSKIGEKSSVIAGLRMEVTNLYGAFAFLRRHSAMYIPIGCHRLPFQSKLER